MTIDETCTCGARFTSDATANVAMALADDWRASHKHTEVGICGDPSSETAGICALTAGHAGFHQSNDGNTHWGYPRYASQGGPLLQQPMPDATEVNEYAKRAIDMVRVEMLRSIARARQEFDKVLVEMGKPTKGVQR